MEMPYTANDVHEFYYAHGPAAPHHITPTRVQLLRIL